MNLELNKKKKNQIKTLRKFTCISFVRFISKKTTKHYAHKVILKVYVNFCINNLLITSHYVYFSTEEKY